MTRRVMTTDVRVRAVAGVLWKQLGNERHRFPAAGEDRDWILGRAADVLAAADKAARTAAPSEIQVDYNSTAGRDLLNVPAGSAKTGNLVIAGDLSGDLRHVAEVVQVDGTRATIRILWDQPPPARVDFRIEDCRFVEVADESGRQVDTSKADAMVEAVLNDPNAYFAEGRRRAYEQAVEERRTGRKPKYKRFD